MKGYIHSLESLGAVDGPGVRYVVFFQGCPLRCAYCHNPDTWEFNAGTEMEDEEILGKMLRNISFYRTGGITATGGEPMMQLDFLISLFAKAKAKGVHTCLDTSGIVLNDKVKDLLSHTDRVLLDVKYTTDSEYRENVGCSIAPTLEFLDYLNDKGIPTTVRQVIIPTVNDTEENIEKLKKITKSFSVIDKIELLPFRKICQVKYDNMGIDFPFGHLPECSPDTIDRLKSFLQI